MLILISFNETKSIMKTQLKKTTIFMLLVICITTSCKKVITKTPEDYRVTWDKYTFGCFVNGVPWIPDYYDYGYYIGPIGVSFFASGTPPNSFFYTVISAVGNNQSMNIYLPYEIEIKKYELNKSVGIYPYVSRDTIPFAQFYKYYPNPGKYFGTNENAKGFVNVTNVNKNKGGKVEGTFEFESVNTTTGEKVNITNGYFKVQY
jgi:Family of unknown function (DUF6252)